MSGPDLDATHTAAQRVQVRAGEDPVISPARTIGRYMVLSQVGQGGVGQVYAAYDSKLDRRIALKLLHVQHTPTEHKRLLGAAKAQARLTHPNVVTVHEVDEHKGRVLLAMEFVHGVSLKQWHRAHPLDAEGRQLEALGLLVQAGRGLAAAHVAGLVHGDFNPTNVLVGDEGRVRVADFGLARPLEQTASAYMAPEQVPGGHVDARTDQFSFAVTAWHVLFGTHPVQLPKPDTTTMPHSVETALRKGLSVRPDGRHADITTLLETLVSAADELRGHVRPTQRWRGWRYVGFAAVLGVGTYGALRLNVARLAQACVAQGDAIDEVWHEERRDAVVAGLAATRMGEAVELGERVTPWLDLQAEAWRTHAREVCLNENVRGWWSAADADKARWCLEDRRLEFAALVEELTGADETAAQNATQAAAGLTPLEACLDDRAIASMVAPPEQTQRDALVQVRRELSRARVLQATGRYAAGVEVARGARQLAHAAGWVPLTARARMREASLLAAAGKYDAAETAGTRAFLEASAGGMWDVAALAAIGLADVVGEGLDRYDEGMLWTQLSEVEARHGGDPLGLREASRNRVRIPCG